MKKTIYVTEEDLKNIKEAIKDSMINNYRNSAYIQQLEKELERAMICAPEDIPADVITMDSRVVLVDLADGEEMELTLVYPGIPLTGDRISVLAPIGIAMLGYRTNDVFEWETPAGIQKLQVKSVLYQPESAHRDD